MKKVLAVVLVSMLLFAGCGNSTSENGNGSENGSTDPVVIKVGYENHPGEPLDVALNEWKDLVEERSDGTMMLELFPSSQLGSKNDIIDQMLAGDYVVTLADGAFYAERGVPDFGIVFGPYLFDSWDEVWRFTESSWYAEQSQLLEEKGLKILTSNWMYGDRHTLTTKPVRTVDDLRGMKIRVPNNTIQVKGFEVLGATPTPMALGDVYTALQQGTIDGLENPLPVLYNGKFHEVAKYLTLDGHVRNFTTWVMGADVFNSLSQEHQEILMQTGDEAGLYNNQLQEEVNEETLELFRAEGVEIIEVDPSEFKQASESFYSLQEFTSVWSEGLYETVKEAMK
ncbi:C4-dicarboxylate TRAP transporter substrate-binding protein [Alkalibacter saccharofermentans]|uniref:Tripartite ATP-independent transporter solute receptor, DctP family n=1 Tax=Alkalibacter saccharofermentans DSM 14828 TaxID=1120975 RepID=A0A1M4W584_9FIRM|nr:C4-dicarboxylate TRAP transporter substrate-binding protein [Alkalibacter saccharofermentans]SHE76434.1 tripartite ATP-independent transporter solute receptor, DctP family [Alkalibacter saccharofermentans DSM 14828]